MASYDYIDKANDDGTVLGQATSTKVGFYGITPVDQPAALTVDVSTITYATATAFATTIETMTTAGYGFMSIYEAMGFLNALKKCQVRTAEIAARLVEAGIVAGGTATAATDTQYDIVGSGGGDDGMILGQDSAALIGFWGTTPIDQPAELTAAVDTIVITCSITTITATIEALVTASAGCGFTSQEQAASFFYMVANLQDRLTEIESRLAETGVIAGGTALVTSTAQFDFLDKGNDDGTIFGRDSSALIGLWGTTPVDQAAALTSLIATLEVTASATVSLHCTLAGVTASVSGYKFTTTAAANTPLVVVQNLQTVVGEIEAALEAMGMVAAN